MSYTQLKANVAGTIIARGAESGEVVQAGQMIFQVARKDGWDAVFDVPAQVMRSAPPDPKIIVALTDDPSVTAKGRVRQVDPQADPVTRTFKVRVSVSDPPTAMRLGATVDGRMELEVRHRHLDSRQRPHQHRSPARRLDRRSREPDRVAAPRRSAALRSGNGRRFRGGLDGGEIVVTAGVQALHPGQKVRLLGAPS